MQSKLFDTFDPNYEKNIQFGKDLEFVQTVSSESLLTVVESLADLHSASTTPERKSAQKAMQEQAGLTDLGLFHVANIANFFVRTFLDDDTRDENPDFIASDLKELGLIAPDFENSMGQFLQRLKEVSQTQIEALQRKKSAKSGVLPVVQGVGTTVELRGVFKDEFETGDSVDEYSPELIETVPVISVNISLDSGSPDSVVFQTTPSGAKLLIDSLAAAVKQADTLAGTAGN